MTSEGSGRPAAPPIYALSTLIAGLGSAVSAATLFLGTARPAIVVATMRSVLRRFTLFPELRLCSKAAERGGSMRVDFGSLSLPKSGDPSAALALSAACRLYR